MFRKAFGQSDLPLSAFELQRRRQKQKKLILIGVGILVQIADLFGIERIATHAKLISLICDRYETELGIILTDRDPRKRLNELTNRITVLILEPNNHEALPINSRKFTELGRVVGDQMILASNHNWGLPKIGVAAQW